MSNTVRIRLFEYEGPLSSLTLKPEGLSVDPVEDAPPSPPPLQEPPVFGRLNAAPEPKPRHR